MSESGGLLESLKRLVGTVLAIVQTRIELLSNEFEDERLRIRQMLLYGSFALFCFGLSIMMLTVFIVVACWDGYRLQVLGGMTALFFIAGILSWIALRRVVRKKSRLFATSLSELQNDRDQLEPDHE
jgi:uncharacterized membrane protein YqjE